jgi:hypothetical protein
MNYLTNNEHNQTTLVDNITEINQESDSFDLLY